MEENVLVFNYSDLRSFVDCFKCSTKFLYNGITFDNFYDFMGYNHLDFLTKNLLPDIIKKFILSKKLFIVENVRNFKLFQAAGIIDLCNKNGIFVYEYGRHTYFTNLMLNLNNVPQRQDFLQGGIRINYKDDYSKYNQVGYNVHQVMEYFLKYCYELLSENQK